MHLLWREVLWVSAEEQEKFVGASGSALCAACAALSASIELIPVVPSSFGHTLGSVTSTEMTCHQTACLLVSSRMWLWLGGTNTLVLGATFPMANYGPAQGSTIPHCRANIWVTTRRSNSVSKLKK